MVENTTTMSKITLDIRIFMCVLAALSSISTSHIGTLAFTINPATTATFKFSRFTNSFASSDPSKFPYRSFFSDANGKCPNQNRRLITAKHMAVIDAPPAETIEKVDTKEKTKDKSKQDNKSDEKFNSGDMEIRLYNDPYNKREFVAMCLTTVCGKTDSESFQIMMEAHNNGMGVIGRYNLERAELYHSSLKENGLLVDMVPVDEGG